MTTTTKSKPKAKKPAPAKKKSFSEEEIEKSIKSAFRNIEGRIAIRHLWTKESMHRFRVNWWDGEVSGAIGISKFVIVTETSKKLDVKEIK